MWVLSKNSSYLRVFFLFRHIFLQIHRRRVRFELCRTTNPNNNNRPEINCNRIAFTARTYRPGICNHPARWSLRRRNCTGRRSNRSFRRTISLVSSSPPTPFAGCSLSPRFLALYRRTMNLSTGAQVNAVTAGLNRIWTMSRKSRLKSVSAQSRTWAVCRWRITRQRRGNEAMERQAIAVLDSLLQVRLPNLILFSVLT